jgi:hypothetical protein
MNKNNEEIKKEAPMDNPEEMYTGIDSDESQDKELYQIDLRCQEIDSAIENYEDILMSRGEETLTPEELVQLKQEYREIVRKRKDILKTKKKSIWDQFPFWMAAYAVFMLVLSFFFEPLYYICYKFLVLIYPLFSESMEVTKAMEYAMLAFIPFLCLLASLIILLSLKNKIHKKIFAYIFLIQGIETLIAVIITVVLTLQNS